MPGKNHRRGCGSDQSTAKHSRLFRQPLRRRALIAVVGLLLPLSATGALMARRSFAPPKTVSSSAPTGKASSGSSAQIRTESAPSLSKEYIYAGSKLIAVDEGGSPSGPQISAPQPNSGLLGFQIPISMSGNNLAPTGTSPAPTISFDQAGVSAAVNVTTSTNTHIDATFSIASNATLRTYNFWVTVNGVNSNQQQFAATSPGGPTINTVAPNTLYTGVTTPLQIQGSNLNQVTSVGFTNSTGLSLQGTIQHPDDTILNISVAVSPTAPTQQNGVFVSGGGQTSNTASIAIAAPPPQSSPFISAVSTTPSPLLVGTDPYTLTIAGSGFNSSQQIFIDPLAGNPFSYPPSSVSADGKTMTLALSGTAYDQFAGFHTVQVQNNPVHNLSDISNVEMFEVDNPVPDLSAFISSNPLLTVGLATAIVSLSGNGSTWLGNGGGTVAYINGGTTDAFKRAVDFISGYAVVTLIAPDLATAGTNIVTIKLRNPAPGGGFSISSVPITVYNPTPTVSSLAPDALPQNAAMPQSLVINGTKFMTGTTVQVGGSPRTPQSPHSSTQMIVPLQSSDVASTGSIAVTANNPTPVVGYGTRNLTVNPPGTCSWVSTYSGDGNYAYLDGTGTGAEWASPTGAVVARDPASTYRCLFVCDTDNQRIRMIYLEGQNTGQSVTIAGNGVAGWDSGGVPATAHKLNGPRAITALTDQATGNVRVLYISDYGNNMIRELIPEQPYSNSNWLLGQFCGNGIAGWIDADFDTSEFNGPKGIFFGWDGYVYVADSANGAIRKIDGSGACSSILHNTAWHTLGVTGSQSRGLIYLSERNTQAIYSFTTAGASQTQLATGFASPWELCLANNTTDGDVLYIPNMVGCQIMKLVLSTNTVSPYAGTGSYGFQDGDCMPRAKFAYPKAVCAGIAGEIYVTDMYNNRIRKIQ